MLGRMWRNITLRLGAPTASAAWTYRFSLADSTSARVTPGVGGDRGDADGDHGVGQTRAEGEHEDQRQDQRGEGQQDVDDPHQDRLHQAAQIAGQATDHDPDRQGDADRHQPQPQRYPGAEDDPAELVAAQGVGAHPVICGGGQQRVEGHHRQGVVGGDERSEDRDDDKEQHHDGAERPATMPQEAPQEPPGRAVVLLALDTVGGRVDGYGDASLRGSGIRAGRISGTGFGGRASNRRYRPAGSPARRRGRPASPFPAPG